MSLPPIDDPSPENPQVSIITVVLNGADHLEQCLKSVLSQADVCCEHIVIDGGSRDGSTEIMAQYGPSLAYTVSEPDRGIADAMNKGIRRARGKWLLFLQSDDYLAGPRVLSEAVRRLGPDDRLGCFSIDRLSASGAVERQRPRGFIWRLDFKTTFTHQGTLFARDLFADFGLYDERLRIDMDYDFYMRLFRAGVPAALHVDHVISVMRRTGLSARTDWPSIRERFREEHEIRLRHAPSAAFKLVYRMLWPPYLAYRWLLARMTPVRKGDLAAPGRSDNG